MTNFETEIKEFHEKAKNLENFFRKLNSVIDITPESELFKVSYDILQNYCLLVEEKYKISGWLEWGWLECKLGDKPLGVSINNGEFKPTQTIDDLIIILNEQL